MRKKSNEGESKESERKAGSIVPNERIIVQFKHIVSIFLDFFY